MLEKFLVGEIFTFFLIFIRVGAGIMVLPGIGEIYVSPRIRLIFALMASLAMTPLLQPMMPAVPGSPLALGILILAETVVGLFIGLTIRIFVAAMHTTGMIISFQSSLAGAMIFDITQSGQSSAIGNMLSMTTFVLLFATDLHHVMLRALFDSYTLFAPGVFPPAADFANFSAALVMKVFSIAVQLASPLIAVGLLVYISAGVLSRLMPTMQVFFVIIPLQLLMNFFVFMAIFSSMMLWYISYFEDTLGGFLIPLP